jgi:CBS domain protein
MIVKDVMTSPVVAVEADSPLLEAIRIMLQRRISGLPPVVDGKGRLVGMGRRAISCAVARPERNGGGPAGSSFWSVPAGSRMNTPVRMGARCRTS